MFSCFHVDVLKKFAYLKQEYSYHVSNEQWIVSESKYKKSLKWNRYNFVGSLILEGKFIHPEENPRSSHIKSSKESHKSMYTSRREKNL